MIKKLQLGEKYHINFENGYTGKIIRQNKSNEDIQIQSWCPDDGYDQWLLQPSHQIKIISGGSPESVPVNIIEKIK